MVVQRTIFRVPPIHPLKTATVTVSNQTSSEAGGRWNFGKVVDLESIILRCGADRGWFGRDDWEADLGEIGWGLFLFGV